MKQFTDKQIEELEAKWFKNGLGFGLLFSFFFAAVVWIFAYAYYNYIKYKLYVKTTTT